MVQHVPAGRQQAPLQVRHHRQAVFKVLPRVAVAPPALQVGLVAFHPQHRGADAAPGGQHLVHPVGQGAHALVRRVAQDVPAAVFTSLGPVGGQPVGTGRRQARVVLAQPCRHRGQAVVAAQALRGLQRVQPAPQVGRGRLGQALRQAEAFQVHQPADAFGPHAGIAHHHIAAHAVAQQVQRAAGRQAGLGGVEQRVQVAQVVGKPELVGGRHAGQAKAAPVRGQHAAAGALQRIELVHHELERGAHVHVAVAQPQRRPLGAHQAGVAPHQQVDLQAAHRHEQAARCAPGAVGAGGIQAGGCSVGGFGLGAHGGSCWRVGGCRLPAGPAGPKAPPAWPAL